MPRKYEPEEQAQETPPGRSTALTVRIANLPDVQRAALLDLALERYGNGESIYVIASELGVEHTTLYRHLINEREDEWKNAKLSKALANAERAEEDLRKARDPLALSRAREEFKVATWYLERLKRNLFGDQQVVAVAIQPVLNITVQGSGPQPLVVETE